MKLDEIEIKPANLKFSRNKVHLWADVYELLSLTSSDKLFIADFEEMIDEDPVPFQLSEEEEEILEPYGEDDALNLNLCGDVQKMVVSRALRFKDYYPFRCSEQASSFCLERKPGTLTSKEMLYCYLLFCSSHNCIVSENDNNIRLQLQNSFESLAVAVFRGYFSKDCITFLFGTSVYSNEEFEHCKNIDDRAEHLAIRLGLNHNLTSTIPSDQKDGGIDVVAMKRIDNDTKSNNIVLIGQAKCSITWHKNVAEPVMAIDRFSERIIWQIPPVPCMIIPFDYRDVKNQWFHKFPNKKILYFDRSRILSCVGQEANSILRLVNMKFEDLYANLMKLVEYEKIHT